MRSILVRSRSEPLVPHVVDVDTETGEARCTCDGWKYRQWCRHITEALEIMERE